jgi:hypothetical protein
MRNDGSDDDNAEFMPLPYDDDLPPDDETDPCDMKNGMIHQLTARMRMLWSWLSSFALHGF